MKRMLLLGLILLNLMGCTTYNSDFAMAVSDDAIYYNSCQRILYFTSCSLKEQKTNGKPVMQRVQNFIPVDIDDIKKEFKR